MKTNLMTWRRFALLAFSALLLAGTTARAQTCPPPTAATCQDPGYYYSDCGVANREECTRILQDSFWPAYDQLPTERVASLPPELGGSLGYVRTGPYNASNDFFYGGWSGDYSGVIQQGQLLARKPSTSWSAIDAWYAQQRAAWQDNGIELTSCQEYAYEKAYDFSQWEDSAGAAGADYRALFNAAFSSANGIAWRPLYSRDGQPFQIRWPEATPKNAFFQFQPGPYPEGFDSYRFDPDLIQPILEAPSAYYHPNFDWHREMSERLSGYVDDELYDLANLQAAFTSRLKQREELWSSYLLDRQELVSHDQDPRDLDAVTTEKLMELDHGLEQALYEARDRGCLQTDGASPCDWSPRLFRDQLAAATVPQREADFQRCLKLTHNDFGPGSLVQNAIDRQVPGATQQSYAMGTQVLDNLLQLIEDTPPSLDPEEQEKYRSQSWSTHWTGGNDKLNGGFDSSFGWGVTDYNAGQNLCDANVYARAQLSAYANVNSQYYELLFASGEGRTEGPNVRAQVTVRVGGYDVYTLDKSVPVAYSITTGPSWQGSVHYPITFVVWVIPVTIDLGLAGQVGLKYGIGASLSRDCTQNSLSLGLQGQVKPYALVNGYASLGIGVDGFQAGVKGSVTIIDVGAPLTVSLTISTTDPLHPLASTVFAVSSNLDFDIGMLDGQIDAFVELFWHTFSGTVFSWNGFHDHLHLLDWNFSVPLASL